MGIMDRDWYPKKRARKASPDDEQLFPGHRWPSGKWARAVVLIVLSLLAIIYLRGWPDRSPAPASPDKVVAERRALALWERESIPSQPPAIKQPRAPHIYTPASPTPEQSEAAQALHAVIELTLLLLALVAPGLGVALFVALFFRRARGPAAAGLAFGVLGGFAGATENSFHLLSAPADSMGGFFQFFEHVLAFFTVAALAAVIVTSIMGNRRARASRAAPTADVDGITLPPGVAPEAMSAESASTTPATTPSTPAVKSNAPLIIGFILIWAVVCFSWLHYLIHQSDTPPATGPSLAPRVERTPIPMSLRPLPPPPVALPAWIDSSIVERFPIAFKKFKPPSKWVEVRVPVGKPLGKEVAHQVEVEIDCVAKRAQTDEVYSVAANDVVLGRWPGSGPWMPVEPGSLFDMICGSFTYVAPGQR